MKKMTLLVVIFLIVIWILTNIVNADNNQFILCEDENLYNELCLSIGESKLINKDPAKKILEVEKTTIDSMNELNLSGKNIRNLKGLEVFTGLLTLDLSGNEISDISNLKSLSKLETLNLSNNNIADLSPLAEMSNGEETISLKTLYLNNNKIVNISPISSLSSLTMLNLANNQIADISGANFSSMGNLKNLYLNGNKIENASALSNGKIEVLNLEKNKISEFKGIALENIKTLNLKNNQISNIEFLSEYENLSGLDLSYNKITTIPEFFANWINNKKIADLKITNQSMQVVSPDKTINFSRNSSYTNMLYWGLYFMSDMKIDVENGNFDKDKIVFEFADINKLSSITLKEGIFADSVIKLSYGGSTADNITASEDENSNANKQTEDNAKDKTDPKNTESKE